MKCTICGSENVTRSHRRGMEKIGKYIIPGTPYRCKECWGRFWVFENPFSTTAARIAGVCIVCLLIAGLAWYLRPGKDETSWQAVQRNVGAVPESSPKEPSTVASPSDLQSKTAQVKTDETEAKSAGIPEPQMSVHENGKTETPVTADRSEKPADSGIISVTPIPDDVSKPESESGNKQDTPPDLPGKSDGETTLPESVTKESETAAAPDKKTEPDKESMPVMPETAKAVPAASDAGPSVPAGSEAPKIPLAEAPQKIRAEHTEKSDSSDAGSPQTGKKETDQAVTAGTVPESAPAVTIAPAKLISEPASFRELKTVKTRSGKEAFEVFIVADGPVRQYNSFLLKSESPPKLVVDLPGKWKHRGNDLFKVKDSMVYRVRVGQHQDFIRVVLDLKISGPVKPVFSDTDRGMTVTLSRNAK
ncbi:MAG: AMIN domain-containing protein [Desulfococcaceae bacterium]